MPCEPLGHSFADVPARGECILHSDKTTFVFCQDQRVAPHAVCNLFFPGRVLTILATQICSQQTAPHTQSVLTPIFMPGSGTASATLAQQAPKCAIKAPKSMRRVRRTPIVGPWPMLAACPRPHPSSTSRKGWCAAGIACGT
jgi:hypothetical protein